MADPIQTSPSEAPAPLEAGDRDSQIEHLLVTGLDHYFAGRYEHAIHVWTRVLFLDRHHPRARAYIERARSAIAERQRRAEELLDQARGALARGDVRTARSAVGALLEHGGFDDEGAALLGRLAQLEQSLLPSEISAARPAPPGEARRSPSPRRARPRVRWGPLVGLAAFLIVVGLYGLVAWEGRAPWAGRQMVIPAATAPPPPLAVPWPSPGELALARAQALYERGRLREALRLLETIGPADPHRTAADDLRATIQRLLLAGSETGVMPTGSARTPQ